MKKFTVTVWCIVESQILERFVINAMVMGNVQTPRKDDDIDDFISQSVAGYRMKSGFDAGIKRTITNLMLRMVAPNLARCFGRYTEQYFHQRLASGFDFIDDWKANHASDYNKFMWVARRLRHRYDFDENQIYLAVTGLLQKKGWILYDAEKVVIWNDILNVKNDIYS